MTENIFSYSADQFDSQETSEEILWKRKVLERWVEHKDTVLIEQEPTDFSDDTYIISISKIWADYGIFPQEMSLFPNPSPFINMLQSAAIGVMERRNLSFDSKYIYAIADPDHEGENDSMRLARGFMVAGSNGYEMDLPIILSKDKDEKDFDLFFALRWAKLDFTDSTKFFDLHLKKNFKNDLDEFSSYVRQIIWQYETFKIDRTALKFDSKVQLLNNKHERSFELWMSTKKLSNVVETVTEELETIVPNILGTPEAASLPVIIHFRKSEVEKALFETLKIYFEEQHWAPLQSLLAGQTIEGFVDFKGNTKRLVTYFLKLDDMKMVQSSKAELQRWLTQYFRCKNPTTKKMSELNAEYVYGILTFQHEIKRNVSAPLLDALNQ